MSTKRCLSLLVSFSLVACGGGGGGMGPDDTGDPGNPGGGGTVTRVIKSNPSFATDIQEIFNRKGCTDAACHGSSAQAGLTLTPGAAHGSLVNVPSTQTSFLRVVPGNAGSSYLVMKVEGSASFGDKMPLGGSALDDIDLTNIRNWINTGAQNN